MIQKQRDEKLKVRVDVEEGSTYNV